MGAGIKLMTYIDSPVRSPGQPTFLCVCVIYVYIFLKYGIENCLEGDIKDELNGFFIDLVKLMELII